MANDVISHILNNSNMSLFRGMLGKKSKVSYQTAFDVFLNAWYRSFSALISSTFGMDFLSDSIIYVPPLYL